MGCVLLAVDSLRGGLAEGNRISETDFFDTLTIQNDQISHVKHVLAPLYAFFTLFGCWAWGGSQGVSGTTCLCNFPVSAAQEWLSLSPLRGALPKAIEFSLRTVTAVVYLDLGPEELFFLFLDPLTLASEELAIFMLGGLFCGT